MTRPISIFTMGAADEANINAQNLSIKEIVARLDPARFHVTMYRNGVPDPRIAARPNTTLLPIHAHGNTARALAHFALHRPDIYFYPLGTAFTKVYLKCREWLAGDCKIVAHVVSDMSGDVGGTWFGHESFEDALRVASAIYANSRFVADRLHVALGISAEVIHNGVDRRFFFPPSQVRPERQDVRVLYAGSFIPTKQPDLLIRVAHRLPGVKFILVGQGPQRESCMRFAAELGCRNIEFPGNMKPATLGESMREADLFAFPSKLEGHPQVLAQAAACGLPCVALSNYRPDAVIPDKTGFLVDDEESFVLAVQRLVGSPELRASMGAAAAEHACQFDWDKSASRWAEVFEQVVRQN